MRRKHDLTPKRERQLKKRLEQEVFIGLTARKPPVLTDGGSAGSALDKRNK